jgi:hypothetical protein
MHQKFSAVNVSMTADIVTVVVDGAVLAYDSVIFHYMLFLNIVRLVTISVDQRIVTL